MSDDTRRDPGTAKDLVTSTSVVATAPSARLAGARSAVEQAAAGVGTPYVACQRLDAPGQAAVNADVVVPIASMYKVLLALEVADAFSDGTLRPDATVTVTPAQQTPGGTGLNQFTYPATITVRDLLALALAWSDNTASDVLLDMVGLDAVQDRAQRLGLNSVSVIGGCRGLLSNAGADFGYPDDEAAQEADWRPTSSGPDLILERTSRATPLDLVKLAALLDADQAGQPAACQLVRQLMNRQAWKTRFADAFSGPAWSRHTKTGTLSPWRGEFGIVRHNDGRAFALAVVLRQDDPWTSDLVVDAAIAAAGKSVVQCVVDQELDERSGS